MLKKIFSDFHWFIDVQKNRTLIQEAVQIQYLVEKGKDGKVQVQAINTFCRKRDKRSGDPLYFNMEHFELLRMCTMNQWILALAWEGCMKKLQPKSASLLGGYILYYEKILDDVMESQNLILLDRWLEIETNFGGIHVEKIQDECGEHGGGMNIIQDVLNSRDMSGSYKITDPRKMDRKQREQVFGAVVKWLLDQCKKIEEFDVNLCREEKGSEKEEKMFNTDGHAEMECSSGRILLFPLHHIRTQNLR